MNTKRLRDELFNDPIGRGYADMTDAEASESLGAVDRVIIVNRRVDERIILAEFSTPAAGEAFLQKLELIAESDTLVARVLRWMRPSEEGVDIGHVATRGMLDSLVGSAGVRQEEVDIIKKMAEKSISRSEELGLGYVASRHINRARTA